MSKFKENLLKWQTNHNDNIRVMPSPAMSCILQQAETMRMASWSTMSRRQSGPSLPEPVFFLFVDRITSFMISVAWRMSKKMSHKKMKNSSNSESRFSRENGWDGRTVEELDPFFKINQVKLSKTKSKNLSKVWKLGMNSIPTSFTPYIDT